MIKDEIYLMRAEELAKLISGTPITGGMAEVMAHLMLTAQDAPKTYQDRMVAMLADEIEEIPAIVAKERLLSMERAA